MERGDRVSDMASHMHAGSRRTRLNMGINLPEGVAANVGERGDGTYSYFWQ